MTHMTKSRLRSNPFPRWFAGISGQTLLFKSITTLVLAAGAGIIMIPFLYLLSTSVKDRDLRHS